MPHPEVMTITTVALLSVATLLCLVSQPRVYGAQHDFKDAHDLFEAASFAYREDRLAEGLHGFTHVQTAPYRLEEFPNDFLRSGCFIYYLDSGSPRVHDPNLLIRQVKVLTNRQSREILVAVAGTDSLSVWYDNFVHAGGLLVDEFLGARNVRLHQGFLDEACAVYLAVLPLLSEAVKHLGPGVDKPRVSLVGHSHAGAVVHLLGAIMHSRSLGAQSCWRGWYELFIT